MNSYFDPGPRPARVRALSPQDQEDIARSRKVQRLCHVLIQYNFTREHVLVMEAGDWTLIARQAGVNPPGSRETVEAVLYALEIHDKIVALRRQLEMRLAVHEICERRY